MVDGEDSASLPPADVQRPTPPVDGCECFHCDRARKGLPPAGDGGAGQSHVPVQRPTSPLTEEELAQCERVAATVPANAMPSHWDLAMHWTPLLIADLRANRERIKELKAEKKVLEHFQRVLLGKLNKAEEEMEEHLQLDRGIYGEH